MEKLPPEAWQTTVTYKARESSTWTLKHVKKLTAIDCNVPDCGLAATSSHDLAMHISICHNRWNRQGALPRAQEHYEER